MMNDYKINKQKKNNTFVHRISHYPQFKYKFHFPRNCKLYSLKTASKLKAHHFTDFVIEHNFPAIWPPFIVSPKNPVDTGTICLHFPAFPWASLASWKVLYHGPHQCEPCTERSVCRGRKQTRPSQWRYIILKPGVSFLRNKPVASRGRWDMPWGQQRDNLAKDCWSVDSNCSWNDCEVI